MFGSKNRARIAELENEVSRLSLGWDAAVIELVGQHANQANALRAEIESLRTASYGADRTAAMYKKLYEGTTAALGKIAALETEHCASIGKRMARLARAELPVLHHDAHEHAQPKANGAAVQAVVL